MDLRVRGSSALGQANHPRATFTGRVGAGEIPEGFETPQQLVHGLLAQTSALGEHARAHAVGAGILRHRHMRHPELLETCRVELVDDAYGLWNPQQGADQHLVRGDRRRW